MKKIFFKIYTFLFYLFSGLRNADKVAFQSEDDSLNDNGGGLEVHDEAESVYKDLLKGELTQEVRELRHEMYYSERESHKFDYIGNGLVKEKKNTIYDYNGTYENSDGNKVEIVQLNKEDLGGVFDVNENSPETKIKREFTFKIERDFRPRFLLEEYVNKLVVKSIVLEENKVILDFYTYKYPRQFDRRHRMFINECERVYQGDKHSDLIDFNNVSFIANDAYGSEDLIVHSYSNLTFKTIIDFEGNYVFRFTGISNTKHDILDEVYDKQAEKKFEENAPRKEGLTIGYDTVLYHDTYDNEKAKELIGDDVNETENESNW